MYREGVYREPCVECERSATTVCLRCDAPLCATHAPAPRRRCNECEKPFARRVLAARDVAQRWELVLIFGPVLAIVYVFYRWPSPITAALMLASLIVVPLLKYYIPYWFLRARFLRDRPRERRPPPIGPLAPELEAVPEDDAATGAWTSADLDAMNRISQAAVAWVAAATGLNKPASQTFYALYDYSHAERHELARVCAAARAQVAPPLVDAISALHDVAAFEYDDGIDFIAAAATTVACDAEFAGRCATACSELESLATRAAEGSRIREALTRQLAGFARLHAHDAYGALDPMRAAARQWRALATA